VFIYLLRYLGHYNGGSCAIILPADRPARDAVLRDRRRAADWLSEEAWLGWLIIIGSIPIGVIRFFI